VGASLVVKTITCFLWQGKAISAAEAFFGMGTMFGPSLGGALYEYGGFSLPFWISGGILIILVILLLLLLEDKSDLYTRLEEEQKVSWLQVQHSSFLLSPCVM